MLPMLIDSIPFFTGLLAGVGIGILILRKRFRLNHFFFLYFGFMILSALWDIFDSPNVTRFEMGLFLGVIFKILKERAADL